MNNGASRESAMFPRKGSTWGVAVASLLAGLLVGPITAEARKPARSERACATTGKTIRSNRVVRVYRVGSREEYRVFGCLRSSGRRYFLGDYELFNRSGFYQGIGRLVVVGRFVAYDRRICSPSGMCTGGTIVRRDLRSGRVGVFANPIPNADPVSDLELTRSGSVAWIRREDPAMPLYTVRKLEGPQGTVLDVGSDVGPSSLVLQGPAVYWIKGGHRLFAPLR